MKTKTGRSPRVSQLYMNNKNSSKSRTCDVRTKNPRFIYFLMLFSSISYVYAAAVADVVVFLYFEFVLKIRFVFHRFALALENHPRCVYDVFSLSFTLLFESRIFSCLCRVSLVHSTGPGVSCVFCVSLGSRALTSLPPMSTHATSKYILLFLVWIFRNDAYGGRSRARAHTQKRREKNFSLAHPIFILACLCPFCVRFYSFDSIFFLPAHTRNIIPRVVSRGATHTLGRIQKKNSGQKEEEK